MIISTSKSRSELRLEFHQNKRKLQKEKNTKYQKDLKYSAEKSSLNKFFSYDKLDKNSSLQEFENNIGDIFSDISKIGHDAQKDLIRFLVSQDQVHDNELTSKSNFRYYIDVARFSSNWKQAYYDGFRLPAQGTRYQICKKYIYFGCKNREYHPENKDYIESQQYHCKKSSCPLCVEQWIIREANRVTLRLEKYRKLFKQELKHVVLSPPQDQVQNMSYEKLKTWFSSTLKRAGIRDCMVVFHPFRFRDTKKLDPYFSPHFHLITSNYLTNTTEFYNKTKWTIINKGNLKTDTDIFNCARYMLSHAGVRKGTSTTRWFGNMSYRKLKVEKEPKSLFCPYCESHLVILCLNPVRKHEPPPIDHVGLYHSDVFDLVDANADKIPFFDLSENPESLHDITESYHHNFQLKLYQKTILSKIVIEKMVLDSSGHRTSLTSKRIDDNYSQTESVCPRTNTRIATNCLECGISLTAAAEVHYHHIISTNQKIPMCENCIKVWK